MNTLQRELAAAITRVLACAWQPVLQLDALQTRGLPNSSIE
jgi:hypothetical protein